MLRKRLKPKRWQGVWFPRSQGEVGESQLSFEPFALASRFLPSVLNNTVML